MERNPTRAKHQKEVLLVAQDVFHYLSSGLLSGREIKKPSEKSNYHQDIGKACSYRLKFARSAFREVCIKEYPDQKLGSRAFVAWFQDTITKNYSRELSTPFSTAIETLGLMFEAALFAFEKGQTNLYQILPFMWTDHFMQTQYPEFFQKGGWHNLKKKAKEIVGTYETFFLTSEAGALELIAGLQDEPEPEPTEEGAAAESEPTEKIVVAPMLQQAGFPPFVEKTSNLAKTLKGLLDLKTDTINRNSILETFTPEATPRERLPGNRLFDPIRTYDTSPEISDSDSPSESPVKKNSGKETVKKKTDDVKQKTDDNISRQNSQGAKKKLRKRRSGKQNNKNSEV